ncbi:MAG: hypothetical protein GDA53_06640 [Rhodobacteraceae bacterium]|nr:hypothetical protein [Paracoccaceae bacterium]
MTEITYHNGHYFWDGARYRDQHSSTADWTHGAYGTNAGTPGDDTILAQSKQIHYLVPPTRPFAFGFAGDDTIIGTNLDDWLQGGLGNDKITGGAGADHIHGGPGIDTADYSGASASVTVSLKGFQYGTALGDAKGDELISIENLIGSAHDDHLVGDNGANKIEGRAGDDYIDGAKGNDVLLGGAGNDRLISGQGDDRMTGGSGADTFAFGSHLLTPGGHDIITDFNPDEGDKLNYIYGNSWGDITEEFVAVRVRVEGTDGVKLTWGEEHSSLTFLNAKMRWFVKSDPRPDTDPPKSFTYEPGFEPNGAVPKEPAETPAEPEAPSKSSYVAVARIPDSTDGFNIVDGRNPAEVTGAQELSGTNRKDWIRGSDGKDVLRGNSGRDYLEGSGGNDFLSGGNARDWLVGGRGGDRLQGGKQDDILTGNQGRDTFVFKAKHGGDIVTDFAVGKDTLELHGVEFSDLTIKKWAKGTGARVEWDEGVIYLEFVQRDALTEDSFEFV